MESTVKILNRPRQHAQNRETELSWFQSRGLINPVASPSISHGFSNSIRNERNSLSIYHRNRFRELLQNWRAETIFYSSVDKITSNRNFQKIVEMGVQVVPFVLEEIQYMPSNLVWALYFIFDFDETSGLGIEDSCKMWVEAGKELGLV